ncbi:type IV pilin [Halanaeroarchaeum sulfurireducens]|uniref:Archaeal Type IV pilin N-terminal domain-containing protein n=1 Tax=Halanaeroarchaeum sulfurireducens TaxID=1604004 RepID=A0A0F7PAR4_9EURY|nr:type IV pilin [Halanaeroarchaeum sulfurireducens]AKH96714.1 hypothetical protein HLASF_0203 [Halanaeroarchaeum sulfurireducens]ALG81116.1 hypothetical protein HLASA_0203 [Halanaeroarchaeum sulfurireducens]
MPSHSRTRAVSPVVGTILLILLTILLVGVIGTVVGGTAALDPSATQAVVVSASADDSGTITLEHQGGPPIDVSAVAVHVSVDGRPLEEQPPVPFFSASGFEPGPTGAFNSASDGELTVGEMASVTVAGTNAPAIDAGSTVTVRISQENQLIASAETSVDGGASDGDEG